MPIDRFATFLISLAVFVVSIEAALIWQPWLWGVAAVAGFLTFVGIVDLTQKRHSLRRNYPILANIRWFAEMIRPEIRQYLIESDDMRRRSHAASGRWSMLEPRARAANGPSAPSSTSIAPAMNSWVIRRGRCSQAIRTPFES